MIPKQISAQRDFSAGEFNSDAVRRDDSDLYKAGARQMRNWRALNSGALTNRPGRLALFPAEGRVDEVLISSGVKFYLCFGNESLIIRNSGGTIVSNLKGYIWTTATLWKIVWTLVPRSSTTRDIVICFPGQRPQIARYDGSTWSLIPFNFAINAAGAQQQPFYRLAEPGLIMQPSATTGTVTLTVAPSSYFTSAMIGMNIRWINHQIRILSVSSGTSATGYVLEELPGSYNVAIGSVSGSFSPGDIIEGATSGHQAEVVLVSPGVSLGVNLLETGAPLGGTEQIVGPNGSATISSQALTSPFISATWDEGVCSPYRGWPGSCFYDQGRLGFCDFASVPGGIAWSTIGAYDDFYVGANPSDPMFEIAPNRSRVYHVSYKGDEIVFTDRGVYYIPISETNPLKPGSVAFRKIRVDAASQVKPAEMSEGLVFLSAGLNRAIAVVQTGSLTQPWDLRESSLLHSHLFTSPVAIAATSSDADIPERYIYVVNSDGTMALGKYNVEKTWAGWAPWDGEGTINWASSLDGILTLTATYSADADVTIAEKLDVDQYVDGAVLINDVATAMQAGVDADHDKLETVTTPIGNMTTSGVLLSAFDGVFNDVAAVCPRSVTAGGATTYGPYIGADWGSGNSKTIVGFALYSPANDSFITGGLSGNCKLQGSADNASWFDLTSDVALTTAINSLLIVHSGITVSTAYRYHRVIFASGTAALAGVAEVQLVTNVAGNVHKSPTLGTGTLWWLAGGTTDLIDGVNPLGTHDVDEDGEIVALNPNEDLTSETIYAGLPWTATLEPFVPHAQPGQDQQQRMKKRRIARASISVQNSTGFVYAGRRISPWNADDDAGAAPPLREASYSFRPVGRSHDPRKTLTKDMPGPLIVTEIAMEVTV